MEVDLAAEKKYKKWYNFAWAQIWLVQIFSIFNELKFNADLIY